ncbi:hypothetical protein ACGVWS_10275 [Enterobacteriaceae bacterium LUAb1]
MLKIPRHGSAIISRHSSQIPGDNDNLCMLFSDQMFTFTSGSPICRFQRPSSVLLTVDLAPPNVCISPLANYAFSGRYQQALQQDPVEAKLQNAIFDYTSARGKGVKKGSQ